MSHTELEYPFSQDPDYGTTIEVAPGVYWLRMPLPMSLNHINLYLLQDDDGWIIVDTGIRGPETRDYWLQILDELPGDKRVKMILCTHMHPDHTGQAGFLSDRFHAPLAMSHGEYYQARVMSGMMRDGGNWQMSEYFTRAGVSPTLLERMREARSSFAPEPEDHPLPTSFIRLTDGERLSIGGHTWHVITGSGHSPEHVCLYSPDHRLLISGDQVLPIITSNVSVQPTEPFANPLVGWLASHVRFRNAVPDDVLVLPAHNSPFYRLHARLEQLILHHEDRMLIIEENCVEPTPAVELLPHLFNRELENHSLFMGLGEAIAHLHCLMSRGRIERTLDGGLYRYRSIDPTLSHRARPGRHEAPEDPPIMI